MSSQQSPSDQRIQLETLQVSELAILLGHLQLGIDHLKKHLNKDQLAELLNYGDINSRQYEILKPDEIERHGNIALMANTVFTCLLGGWLATIGFIGISPAANKYLLFFILIAAVIGSGYFGYVSFKKIKEEAKDAVKQQKLANLQLKLLSLIEQKKQHTVEGMTGYLNRVFDNSSCKKSDVKITSLNTFKSKEQFVQWFNELNNNVSAEIEPFTEKIIYKIFIKEIKKIKFKLKKAIDTNIGLLEHHQDGQEEQHKSFQESTWFSPAEDKQKNFINVLTDPTIVMPKAELKKKSWLKNNIYSILNGLAPTALGGFCSLFTYFKGIPDIAKEFGLESFTTFFESPTTKLISLFILFSITLYFAYVSAHGDYKSFQRSQELEKTQKHIANKDNELLVLNSTLNLLKKVKKYVENILLILAFMRHISSVEDANS